LSQRWNDSKKDRFSVVFFVILTMVFCEREGRCFEGAQYLLVNIVVGWFCDEAACNGICKGLQYYLFICIVNAELKEIGK
jgi:hypothetical protein